MIGSFTVYKALPPILFALVLLLAGCLDNPGATPKQAAPSGMVYIPGGTFRMGIEHPMMPDARPVHQVAVDPFWIDATEVTNRDFTRFVDDTGYVTVAERPLDPADFPGADPALLAPGSVVFQAPSHPVPLHDERQWWAYVPGANWRHPEGPESSIDNRMDHPVVHITWDDAVAYAQWADKRLPTEAEWEFAARGGQDSREFVWGDEQIPEHRHMTNIFQGDFPHHNTAVDGYEATAPVKSFSPNGYGLYDVSGNAWEWVQDWYNPTEYRERVAEPVVNPRGPDDTEAEGRYKLKVQKGGSFLCTDQFCARFRPGARGKGSPDTGNNHVGFRLVRDIAN